MHTRADAAVAALLLNYWPQLRTNTSTFDWKFAHYWDAILDASERRGQNAFSGTARMFYELQKKRGWLDDFYDDENWITLALLHSYKVTGEAMYLNQAQVVFADIMKAWDVTCCGAKPGGMFWKTPATNKVTAINAGAVISGARLYAATQDSAYLAFAQKVYAFWSTNMVDHATGHVHDGMNNAGTINTVSFTYNERLFIGAIVELARVTGDTSQFALAHKVAGYMMSKESKTTTSGTVLDDFACGGDLDMFKGIGARYLGELYEADPTHLEYRDFLARSAASAWTLARDPASGKISCDWGMPYDSARATSGTLGTAAIGIAAAARALGPGVQRPALTYEAEEGHLHSVGVEALYGAFSGWGVRGGLEHGLAVGRSACRRPRRGQLRGRVRYAAGSTASRSVSVNGAVVTTNLAFPGTCGNTTYAAVTTTVSLLTGRNTLSIADSGASGNGGSLNWIARCSRPSRPAASPGSVQGSVRRVDLDRGGRPS